MLLDMGYSIDPDEASAQLRIHLDILPTELPEDWKEFPMGWHIMWSTFDPDSNFPFGDPLSQGRHILCSSGLGSDLWPVLVLEYNLPNNVEPHIPRFCDAYAGKKQGWIRYFRPAIEGAPYGRTMPTDTCPIQVGRPEVVHVVVKMRNLIRPMRYAP
jgi:hypothetical protein